MVRLYQPNPEDLWFRQELMNDPETMSYNDPWGGTIPFPKTEWADWYDEWLVHHEEKRFYRYLKNEETDEFVGEIAYHLDEQRNIYIANVIIYAKFRGKGYGEQGLSLLLEAARKNGLTVLHDDFLPNDPAIRLFEKYGFVEDYRTTETIMFRKKL